MTSTLPPRLSAPARPLPPLATARPSNPWLVGARSALGVTVAGLLFVGVPALAIWLADHRSGSGAAQALRLIGALWLLAGGSALDVPGGTVSLAPLGLSLLPAALLWRAASRGARACDLRSARGCLVLAVATALPYTAFAVGLARLVRTSDIAVPLPQVVLAALVLAGGATVAGAARAVHRRHPLGWASITRWRRELTATAAATCGLLAGGALLVAASLAAHGPRAVERARASSPGTVGGAGLLLAGVALLPNAVVLGASWLAGPGFAVGLATSVGPFGTDVGAVPALPLLAAVPGQSPPSWAAVLSLLVPVVVGVVTSTLLLRPSSPSTAPGGMAIGDMLLTALRVGALVGLLWTLLGWLAGGRLGDGRLQAIGPAPLRLGLALAAEVGVGVALAGVAAVLRARRSSAPTS